MSAPDQEILIQAERVSKKFCRSLRRSLWYGVRDITAALNPFGGQVHSEPDAEQLRKDEFWAVRDVSFEVRRGECLGLIGHNGAGKSTLLKMLNSLNRPDRGRIIMRGRVGALIELGAGFNPILTGRENIYNQAALLGFSRRETDSKFDAIVDFSELEEFLDTPVQNYSSGMKVKLGFAVSSQMEPDILLIDEVLAVGDVGFRYKCLNKIAELLNQCAVIFVSHSMTQVMRVCTGLLVLKKGETVYLGRNLANGLETYFRLFSGGKTSVVGTGEIRITNIKVTAVTDECKLGGVVPATHGDRLSIQVDVDCDPHIENATAQILFWNQELIPVLDAIGADGHGHRFSPKNGKARLSLEIDSLALNAGKHQVSVVLTAPDLSRTYCHLSNSFGVDVIGGSPASRAGCLVVGTWNVT